MGVPDDEAIRCDPTLWVAEHGDSLFRYALLRVQDREVAEDLIQETFLAALAGRECFSGRSAERTWLVAILRRKIVDHFRRAARAHSADDDRNEPIPRPEDFDSQGFWKVRPGRWPAEPARVLKDREFRQAVHACVSKLPGPLAAAFVLRELEELGTEEVCQVLGISPSNLWVRLHRARLLMRRCLEHTGFAHIR